MPLTFPAVGDYLSSSVATGSAVALTTATVANIASISLPAGDWDVSVDGYFNNTATTVVNAAFVTISAANNTLDQTAGRFGSVTALACNGQVFSVKAGPYRIAGGASIFFNAYSGFSASTLACWGIIRARRAAP
jgi:hypothetical protein